jgi:DNA-binding transcriptional LysR family regulator
MLNWDDLRVFAAASRSASLAAAGQQLGMDASTVGRRILRLETQLKARLIVRSPNGLQLTQSGNELRELALTVEEAMAATGRPRGAGPVSGVVRVSLPEGLGGVVFVGHLLSQAARYPDLNLELAESGREVDLAYGETDIAVSLARPPAGAGPIEQLGRLEIGLFASPEYVPSGRTPAQISDLEGLRYIRWLERAAIELDPVERAVDGCAKPAVTAASLALQLQAIKDGGGFGFLPEVMGRASGLMRLLPEHVRAFRALWMSSSRELAETARCRAVRAWLREAATTGAPLPSSVVPFGPLGAAAHVKSRRTA